MEFGEKVEDNLRKEIKEEYATDVLEFEFLGYRDVHRTHDGKKTHWIALDFKVLVDALKVSNGEPHKFSEVEWFTLQSLPEKMHSEMPRFFEIYESRIG
ncbi:MAG: NUDIX domain-containing protein [Candidatus Moranbacteria bacterium]|nr:NUDIX domain-containing protein [Candidatus Moranbacteria bacterium]